MMTGRTLSAIVLVLMASTSCTSVPPLANTRQSSDALARDVLDALARNDREALEGLALSETEFRDHVWPELPAARPERNLPFSYVWGDLRQKSIASLSAIMRRYGGQTFELVRVSFGDETPYQSYKVRREATLLVRDSGGAEQSIRVCGSMIEKDGGWKVFSYVVDGD